MFRRIERLERLEKVNNEEKKNNVIGFDNEALIKYQILMGDYSEEEIKDI